MMAFVAMPTLVRQLASLLTIRERRRVVLLMAMMCVGAALEVLGVGAIPAFLMLLNDGSRIEKSAILRGIGVQMQGVPALTVALTCAAALLILFLVKNAYLAFQVVAQSAFIRDLQVRLAYRMLNGCLSCPYEAHLQRNSAEVQHHAIVEALEVVGNVVTPLMTLMMNGLVAVAITVLLLSTAPIAALSAFAFIGAIVLAVVQGTRIRLARHGARMQRCRLDMIRIVNEGLGSLKVAKLFGRERYFLAQFADATRGYCDAARYRQVMTDVPRMVVETAAVAGFLATAAVLLLQRDSFAPIVPTLSLLGIAVVRLVPCFNTLNSSVTALRYGRFPLDVVLRETRQTDAYVQLSRPKVQELTFERCIEFDNVWYRYPAAVTHALARVSAKIDKGSIVAFVGHTGSGKSTIVDVMLGLLRPTDGRVLVDGVDIHTSIRGWQSRIGYVPQDIYLTDDSLLANIALGVPRDQIDETAAWSALEAAQLADFVRALPQGIETSMGERGIRMSGGQRQRIGIARALYSNPDVLVLDEATSALDMPTEAKVMQALHGLRGSRTIILIAHRMSSLRTCDKLFVVHGDRLEVFASYDDFAHATAGSRASEQTRARDHSVPAPNPSRHPTY
jgi:ATP-binding cassette subfamily C protein